MIKIGMGQILVEYDSVEKNINSVVSMLKEASTKGCQIVVLPECIDIGWGNPDARNFAEPIPGTYSDQICQAAIDNNIYVVVGMTERMDEKLYNAALLISSQGEILLKHRKINLLDIESMYSVGDGLSVVETPFGTIGVSICADNLPDSLVLGHALARMGAQLILSPSAWAVDADHDNTLEPYGDLWKGAYHSLSSLYGVTIVGVSNVGWISKGSWKGRKCIGSSIAVGPEGLIKKGAYGVDAHGLIDIELSLRQPIVTGTSISPMLREKGYQGP